MLLVLKLLKSYAFGGMLMHVYVSPLPVKSIFHKLRFHLNSFCSVTNIKQRQILFQQIILRPNVIRIIFVLKFQNIIDQLKAIDSFFNSCPDTE